MLKVRNGHVQNVNKSQLGFVNLNVKDFRNFCSGGNTGMKSWLSMEAVEFFKFKVHSLKIVNIIIFPSNIIQYFLKFDKLHMSLLSRKSDVKYSGRCRI